ncbi:unnamed protein product, partial [Meganyctiphanes norvegica]
MSNTLFDDINLVVINECKGASANIIDDERKNKLKVMTALDTIARPVMLTTYQCYKPFDNLKSLKDYFITDKGKTNKEYKRVVNEKRYRDEIATADPSGAKYDSSLLNKCIIVLQGLDGPADKDLVNLVSKCQDLANKRNSFAHNLSGVSKTNMETEINDIKTLSLDILACLEIKRPGKSIEISDMRTKVKDRVKKILEQPLTKDEILKAHLNFLKDQTVSYKKKCEKFGKLNILDFLSGDDRRQLDDINLVFTEAMIEQSKGLAPNTPVDCKDIIDMAKELNILLLDSEPGGGKSTIMQYCMNDWSKGRYEMKTGHFTYIFPMFFRNKHVSSVGDLIRKWIPDIKTNMSDSDIEECLKDPSMNILFFCDGLDERNDQSNKLFEEICNLKENNVHIKVVVTARPESVPKLNNEKPKGLIIDHLKVKGVHENKRPDFLMKYHGQLYNNPESTDELITYYKSISARHKDLYRLPLNLVILAYLWGKDKDTVKSIYSASGLYIATLKTLKGKLYERISEKSRNYYTFKNDFDELTGNFEEKVFTASLNALKCDDMSIDKKGIDTLRSVCRNKEIPNFDEVTLLEELKGAYLLSSVELNPDVVESLEIPHKGYLDFYAAKCIANKLTQGGTRVKDILLDLYDNDQSQYDSNISKFQNVLQ